MGPARARPRARHIAHGRLTRQRLHDFYGIESEIVHPPVEVDRFAAGEPEDWVLAVGELVAHKRVDNAEVAEVLRSVDFTRFDPRACRANAERFSVPRFKEALRAQVHAALSAGR